MTGGRYNLTLFCQLFWIVVAAFLAFQITFWLSVPVLRGSYIINKDTKAWACLMEEQQSGAMHQRSKKNNMLAMAFPMLIIIWITWHWFSAKRFLAGICPRGRTSCMGKYRRNVLTLGNTYLLLMALSCCRVAGTPLALLSSQMSPTAQFWIWNISATLWGEGAYLLLPWLLAVPQASSPNLQLAGPQASSPAALQPTGFYVRKPALQPRPEYGNSWKDSM